MTAHPVCQVSLQSEFSSSNKTSESSRFFVISITCLQILENPEVSLFWETLFLHFKQSTVPPSFPHSTWTQEYLNGKDALIQMVRVRNHCRHVQEIITKHCVACPKQVTLTYYHPHKPYSFRQPLKSQMPPHYESLYNSFQYSCIHCRAGSNTSECIYTVRCILIQ